MSDLRRHAVELGDGDVHVWDIADEGCGVDHRWWLIHHWLLRVRHGGIYSLKVSSKYTQGKWSVGENIWGAGGRVFIARNPAGRCSGQLFSHPGERLRQSLVARVLVRDLGNTLLKSACGGQKVSMNEYRDVGVRHSSLLCSDGAQVFKYRDHDFTCLCVVRH